MYSTVNHPPIKLVKYLALPHIKSISFDKTAKTYSIIRYGCPQLIKGLTNTLERKYYPAYIEASQRKSQKQSVKWSKRAKKGSSKKLGTTVDKHLDTYVKSNYTKVPKHKMTNAIIRYIEDTLKHRIVGSQVPCFLKDMNCVTQADLISVDDKQRLWMLEIKTGYPVRRRNTGTIAYTQESVPNTTLNHYHLQKHFTVKALRESGLDIYQGCIIHAYNERCKEDGTMGITVKKLSNPKWVNKYFN